MELPIRINKDSKFKWIVEIMSCMQPFKSLRPRERELIAKILKLSYDIKDVPKEQRKLLIFHQDNKKKMAEEMNMTMENFYNLILSLRKKGILDDYGVIDKYCTPFMQDLKNINFKFIE